MAWSTTNTFRITTMAGGSGSVSLERPTHPLSPGGPPCALDQKGIRAPRAWDTDSPDFGPRTKQKDRKEKKTKETQMAARLRGEEEKEQESMQAAEVQEGRSGARAAGAAAAPAGSSKASFGPSSSMRSCRPVPVCLQVFPSQEGRPPGIPEKGQCLDSIQQAQKCPSLKCRRRPSQRFLDFTLGGFKRLLRVSEGGTHAGWRAGEPLILDQSQCPSLIRPWRGNEK